MQPRRTVPSGGAERRSGEELVVHISGRVRPSEGLFGGCEAEDTVGAVA